MKVALIYQEPACVWRRHAELYKKHNAKVAVASEILKKRKIEVSTWSSIRAYLDYRQTHAVYDELVFPAIENCFERSRAGLVSSIWELLDIPYVGNDPYAFTVSTDKLLFQSICERMGIKCPHGFEISSCMSDDRIKESLDSAGLSFPLVLKYRYGTLSYGLSLVKDVDELIFRSHQLLLTEPESTVLCQEYISGREFTVPIIGSGEEARALAVIQYAGPEKHLLKIYDTQWKNELDEQIRLLPLPEGSPLRRVILSQCLTLYHYLNFRDMTRFDLRVTDKDDIYFLEANCLPNLSYESAFDPQSYGAAKSFDDVFLEIIRFAWQRNRKRLGEWNLAESFRSF